MKFGLIATTIIVMLLGARDNYRPKISVDLAKVLVSAGVDNTSPALSLNGKSIALYNKQFINLLVSY